MYLEITCKCPSPAEASPASAGGGRREKTIAAAAVDEYQQKSSAPKKFVNVFGGQVALNFF